ncbi:hypothetical protein O181_100612 [Austropuccinia psidii MF-1]|uniref:Uncharacterized protein n=1 Tax=Austropuccinia psidii MF-1 TaxID=1389203 RepID=A0A9Q3JFK3_9BASI|nr:hypothetical protein [Austropuccinia psidii MF-1]
MSDLNHFEQRTMEIQSQYKSLFMVAKTERIGTSSKSLDRNNELISSSEEFDEPRKDIRPSEGLETHVLQKKVQQIKAGLKNQSILSEDKKKKLAEGKDNSPVEAPQASTRKNPPPQVPENGKQAPKSNQKGKKKANSKWNKPYQQNYRTPKKERKAMETVFNMERTFMEFKNKEYEIINHSFPKK